MQLCLNMNIFILQTDVKKGETKCWRHNEGLPRVILCPFRLAVSQRLGCERPEILAYVTSIFTLPVSAVSVVLAQRRKWELASTALVWSKDWSVGLRNDNRQ